MNSYQPDAANSPDVVLAQWERWWTRENTGALPYIIYPKGDVSQLRQFEKDWMPASILAGWDHWKPELMSARALELTLAEDNPRYIAEWLDYLDAYADLYGHMAGGFNFICPGFGPANLSAFLSGFFRYCEPTVWMEPAEPWEYAEIDAAITSPPPQAVAYRELAFDLMRRMAERFQGKYVISIPDFGDGMDILSSLRHNMNLLTDLYDCPEDIQRTLQNAGQFARQMFEQSAEILLPANGGACASVMRYLSAVPHYMTYSDFSAMIGPAHFEEFVLPIVQRHCRQFPGRTIYHLDGTGELPHVPLLCAVEELFAIQWVQGAGKPGPLDPVWDDLYRQLLDAGKRISIGGSVNTDYEAFFRKFPASEFTISIVAGNEDAARDVARRLA